MTWLESLDLPVPLRWALVGAVTAGVLGGVAGLAIGLEVYAPTAWFAIFEVGVPTAIVGSVVGLACGAVVLLVGRVRHVG